MMNVMSQDDQIMSISAAELKQYIERAENLEEEKATILEHIKEVFAEAKARGFDVKVMKQLMKIRKMKKEDLVLQEELLELYRRALNEG